MNWICRRFGHKFVTVYDEHPRPTRASIEAWGDIRDLLYYRTVNSTYCKRCGPDKEE